MVFAFVAAAPEVGRAASLTLSNGDTLSGEIVEETDAHVVIEHPVLGRIQVERSQLQQEKKRAGLLGTSFLEGWKRHFEVGMSGSSGNTTEQDFRVALVGSYEDEERRWNFNSAYKVQRTNHESTSNALMAELGHDWLFDGSPWFTFAALRFDWDQFKDWDNRVIGSGGVGYEFVKREDFNLRGRTGASLARRSGVEDDLRPEILLGLESTWKLNSWQVIRWATTLYPSVDDFGEFRSVSTAEWVIALTKADGLSFKLGVENEYESDVEAGTENNDLSYYGALVFDF